MINNCYTLEISFCGADYGKSEYLHYNTDMFKQIASTFCLSILDLADPEQTKVNKANEEIELNYLTLNQPKKEDAKNAGNQEYDTVFLHWFISDQDSDYSGDEENVPKIENTNNSVNQSNTDTAIISNSSLQAQNPFSQNVNAGNILANSSLPLGGGAPLTVINELEDKKAKSSKITKKKKGK